MVGESSKTTQPDSFMNVPNVTASKSDSTATKPGEKVMTVKTTIKNIWKPEFLQPVNFNLNEFVRKEFFVEVFLSLIAQILPQITLYECTKIQTALS
ncbi:hypothetical protein BD408DRAFT_419409 [Parasitella parasitica]|nr:hypothetical protein BD408DRAFT_419409 [Parasitella parasitica]